MILRRAHLFSIEILQQHDASLEMANPGDSNAMSNEVGFHLIQYSR